MFKQYIGNFQRFLEIGCGTGFVLEAIHNANPSAKVYGSEYFEEGLAYARKRVPSANLSQLDAREMLEIKYYDVIGAFDVIEHIQGSHRVQYLRQRTKTR